MKKEPEEPKELMEIFGGFHRMNLASMLPDLTEGEFAVLKAVKCCRETAEYEKEVRISDLAEHLQMLAPSISRSMRSLEERGLLIREIYKKDRRNIHVMLTTQGERKLEEAEQILGEFQQAVFGRVGPENMSRLIQYLRRLQEVMKEEISHRKYTVADEEKNETDPNTACLKSRKAGKKQK